MPVDQQENASIEISGAIEAAYAHKTVVAVISDVKTADGSEDVGERAIAMLLDLIRRNYGDRRRRFLCALHVPGGGVHLDLHQVLKACLRQILRARLRGTGQSCARYQHHS
jgi:hypothetical protein